MRTSPRRSARRLRPWVAVAALVALAAVLAAGPGGDAGATNAIAKREGQVCTACHDKPGSKLLTDEGLYYEVTGSLEGYREVESAFGRCTYCHSREPGSEKLTGEGEKLAGVVEDMEGLQEWVVDSHPESIRKAIAAAEGEPMKMPAEADDAGMDAGMEMEVDEPMADDEGAESSEGGEEGDG